MAQELVSVASVAAGSKGPVPSYIKRVREECITPAQSTNRAHFFKGAAAADVEIPKRILLASERRH